MTTRRTRRRIAPPSTEPLMSIGFSLPPDLFRQGHAAAAQHGVSLSLFLRDVLAGYVRSQTNSAPKGES